MSGFPEAMVSSEYRRSLTRAEDKDEEEDDLGYNNSKGLMYSCELVIIIIIIISKAATDQRLERNI